MLPSFLQISLGTSDRILLLTEIKIRSQQGMPPTDFDLEMKSTKADSDISLPKSFLAS